MSCPFCHLRLNRNPVIYEGQNVIVFPSNPRLMPGHLLVVPKRHIERPSQMTADERKELFDTVLLFQDKIINKVSQGCDIRENYHPFRKEDDHSKVHHIHFHLIPRNPNDDIYEKYEKLQLDVFHMLTPEEIDETIQLLKGDQ